MVLWKVQKLKGFLRYDKLYKILHKAYYEDMIDHRSYAHKLKHLWN